MSMTPWDKSAEKRLEGLVRSGMPYSQIAVALGRSKNACVARAHKLGLKGAGSPPGGVKGERANKIKAMAAEQPKPAPTPVAERPKLILAPVRPKARRPRVEIKLPDPIRLPCFTDGMISMYCDDGSYAGFASPASCRWIEGDLKDQSATCCTAPAKPGSSYCETHHKRVWVKPTKAVNDRLANDLKSGQWRAKHREAQTP